MKGLVGQTLGTSQSETSKKTVVCDGFSIYLLTGLLFLKQCCALWPGLALNSHCSPHWLSAHTILQVLAYRHGCASHTQPPIPSNSRQSMCGDNHRTKGKGYESLNGVQLWYEGRAIGELFILCC